MKTVKVVTISQFRTITANRRIQTVASWVGKRAQEVVEAAKMGARIIQRLDNPSRPALLLVTASSMTVIPMS